MPAPPHDRLFREVFALAEEAEPLLRWLLPSALSENIQWTTLERVSEPSRSDDLSQREPDLVYTATYGAERCVQLHFLTEHQSKVDPSMPRRFLAEMLRAWDQAEAEGRAKPVCIPILVSHDERGWPTGGLATHLDLPPAHRPLLEPYLPSFRIVLDDLSTVDEASLGERGLEPYGEAALRMLKVLRRSPRPVEDLRRWLPIFDRIHRGRLSRLRRLFNYFISVSDADPREAVEVLSALGPKETRMGMTAAERLINEGRAEGEARGRAETLLRQLRLKFPEAVSVDVEARVRNASTAELDVWTDRILFAETLDGVIG